MKLIIQPHYRFLPKNHITQEASCSLIMVTNPDEEAYRFHEEVVITRRVTVQGNSLTLPFLDCSEAERCFRVKVRLG